jgi:transposase
MENQRRRPRLEPFYDVLCARVTEQQGDVTIAELRTWILREHGVSISHAVMWKTLARLGLTLKNSASTRPSRTAGVSSKRASPGLHCEHATSDLRQPHQP